MGVRVGRQYGENGRLFLVGCHLPSAITHRRPAYFFGYKCQCKSAVFRVLPSPVFVFRLPASGFRPPAASRLGLGYKPRTTKK
jgi:hypothetical protein